MLPCKVKVCPDLIKERVGGSPIVDIPSFWLGDPEITDNAVAVPP